MFWNHSNWSKSEDFLPTVFSVFVCVCVFFYARCLRIFRRVTRCCPKTPMEKVYIFYQPVYRFSRVFFFWVVVGTRIASQQCRWVSFASGVSVLIQLIDAPPRKMSSQGRDRHGRPHDDDAQSFYTHVTAHILRGSSSPMGRKRLREGRGSSSPCAALIFRIDFSHIFDSYTYIQHPHSKVFLLRNTCFS